MKKISLALLLAVAVIAGCGKKDGGTAGNQYGLSTKNNIVWWSSADITNIIPYLAHDAHAQYAYPFIWEAMNTADPHTQELLPWLTSVAEISPDHLTYTYTVNPNVKFNDGIALTGEDIVFSFKCVMNPRQIETTQTRSVLTSVDSINFVGGDKMKVSFHLNKPYFQMDRVLAGGYVPILPKHTFDPDNLTDQMNWKEIKAVGVKNPVFQKQADQFNDPAKIRDPKMMVGTGAYFFQEWKTNDHITFKKNPNYWAKDMAWGEAYPEQIIFKTITDNNSAVTALKGKEVDFMDLVPTALFVQLDSTKQPFIRKDTVYYNSMTYMEWNSEKPLFKSSKIRWALSHLIDRDQIVKNILKGVAIPLNGVINFTQPHYDASQKPITFDPELAKKMLTEEGWVDSDGDGILDKVVNGKKMQFRFTMNIYTGSDVIRQAALVIAEQMRKVGIQVDVSSTEWTVWIENNRQHNYDVSIANIGGNSTEDDPYELWHSSQARNKGQNVTSFINSEVDQILEQNRVEFDFAKRDILMKRFQKILYDELPITPLFSTPARLARIDRFDNVEFYRQRPCVNVPYWTVRGSGVVAKVGAPSTIKALHQ